MRVSIIGAMHHATVSLRFLARTPMRMRMYLAMPTPVRTLACKRMLAGLGLGLIAWSAQAKPVATLNGAPIHDLTLDTLYESARQKQPGLSRAGMLDQVVANRLLAATASTRFKQYDLGANRRVAFDADVASENSLISLLTPLYDAKNGALTEKQLQAQILAEIHPNPKQWDAVFGKEGKLLLDYSLSQEQLAQAKSLILLKSKVPGGQAISLYDVVRRLNVQGRVEFFNRNFQFVQQQARQRLASLIVLNFANHQYGAPAVADLRAALAEREQAHAVLALHGIGADIDADSELIVQLLDKVSQPEIKAYYSAHLDQFKRINKVKARHIRVADETSARQLLAQLAKGADFAQLAREKSIAEDAKQGGDLGWIVHESKMSWLADLALTQQAGQVSPPFRAPVGPNDHAYYEIVKVEQREDGYQAVDSESVRYGARRAVAQQKAVQQITELQTQLRQQAKLEWLDVRYRPSAPAAGAPSAAVASALSAAVAPAAAHATLPARTHAGSALASAPAGGKP
jgi:parvulin-like peptidyl-prolyl isomerase